MCVSVDTCIQSYITCMYLYIYIIFTFEHTRLCIHGLRTHNCDALTTCIKNDRRLDSIRFRCHRVCYPKSVLVLVPPQRNNIRKVNLGPPLGMFYWVIEVDVTSLTTLAQMTR